MIFKYIYIITVVGLFAFNDVFAQYPIEAFSHPINKNPIELYKKPNKFYKTLLPDTEAGWTVTVIKKEKQYFELNIEELSLYNVWVKVGDIGLIIQNNNGENIPLYINPSTTSSVKFILTESYIGKIYDIKDDFVLVRIKDKNNKCICGWVERRYLCSNPYTTCN